jgi:Fic family protein
VFQKSKVTASIIDKTFAGQPRQLGPLLARVDTGKGREALYEDRLPELLHQLADDTRVASITASNAIAGVIVESARAEKPAEGSRRFRNRNERELAGYRDAVDELMRLDAHEPLVLTGALILDLLAIHPVADGNGRLARLLTTHELLAGDYRVARHVSIEQRIYESRTAYYTGLYESQRQRHQRDHDIWPWITYLAGIVASAYEVFEGRIASARSETGNKQERVRGYVLEHATDSFRRRDVARALPGVSEATIRLVLADLRGEGKIASEGSGPGAGGGS